MMIKRSLLAASIAALSAQMAYAAPFMPLDARGMAMGNTGVANAQHASAPAYNPSLLSQTYGRDHLHIMIPQVGISFSDEREVIDQAQDISDGIIPQFEDALDGVNGNGGLNKHLDELSDALERFNDAVDAIENFSGSDTDAAKDAIRELQASNNNLGVKLGLVHGDVGSVDVATKNLTSSMENISGNPLSLRAGVGALSVALPGKTLGTAVSVQGSGGVSVRMHFKDAALMNAYAPAVSEYLEATQDLNTSIGNIINPIDADNATLGNLTGLKTDLSGMGSQLNEFSNGFTSKNSTYKGSPVFNNGEFSDEMSDPNLESTVQAVGMAVVDLGISLSHEFEIMNRNVAIGVTPKLQMVSTFHYAAAADDFDDIDEEKLKDQKKDYTKINLDVGASYRFGESKNWTAGLVIKNLLGGKFKYEDVTVTRNGLPEIIKGGEVNLNPQMRAGLAYRNSWVNLAADLDLLENKPIAYESATQYAAFGGEIDIFRTLQLRAGYRLNIKDTDQGTASVGFGLSPFGLHIDLAAFANPSDVKKEAGAVLQTGFKF